MPGPNGEPAGRGILTSDTLALMFTPAVQLQDPGEAWGLGYNLLTLPDGSELIKHGGSNTGWRAFFEAVPEWGDGIVVLTHSENGMALVEEGVTVVSAWVQANR